MLCPHCHCGFLELIEHPIPVMPDFSGLLRQIMTAGNEAQGMGAAARRGGQSQRSFGAAAGTGTGRGAGSRHSHQHGAHGQGSQQGIHGQGGQHGHGQPVVFHDFLQHLFETLTEGGAAAGREGGPGGFEFRVNINGQEMNPDQGMFLNFLQTPGNYVFGDNIDAIVTQLLNQVEGGAPPLSSDSMKQLKKSEVTAENVKNKLQCPVCFENFVLKEKVTILPCKHTFHDPCITPWLGRHNSCPVCRKPAGEDGPAPPPGAEQQDGANPGAGTQSAASGGMQLMEDNEFD